jgi:hypothetical protein
MCAIVCMCVYVYVCVYIVGHQVTNLYTYLYIYILIYLYTHILLYNQPMTTKRGDDELNVDGNHYNALKDTLEWWV